MVSSAHSQPEPKPFFKAEVNLYSEPSRRAELLLRLGSLNDVDMDKAEKVVKDLKLDGCMYNDEHEMDITVSNSSQAYGLFAAFKAADIAFRNPYKSLLSIQEAVKEMNKANKERGLD